METIDYCDRQGCVNEAASYRMLADNCEVGQCTHHALYPEELNLPGVYFHAHSLSVWTGEEDGVQMLEA